MAPQAIAPSNSSPASQSTAQLGSVTPVASLLNLGPPVATAAIRASSDDTATVQNNIRLTTTVTTKLAYRTGGPQDDFEYTKHGTGTVDTIMHAAVENYQTTYIFMSDNAEYTQTLPPPSRPIDPQTIIIAKTAFPSNHDGRTFSTSHQSSPPSASSDTQQTLLSASAPARIILSEVDKALAKCPTADGYIYDTGNGCDKFEISCHVEHQDTNFDTMYTSDFTTCMDLCSHPRQDGQVCGAVGLVPPSNPDEQAMGSCHLKSGIDQTHKDAAAVWSARRVRSCALEHNNEPRQVPSSLRTVSHTTLSSTHLPKPAPTSPSHSSATVSQSLYPRSEIGEYPRNDGSSTWVT